MMSTVLNADSLPDDYIAAWGSRTPDARLAIEHPLKL
jgi:hypothetical protein